MFGLGKKGLEEKETESDLIDVRLVYNLKTNTLSMKTSAPTVMLYGILEMAKSVIQERQILNKLNQLAAEAQARGPQIIPANSMSNLPPAPNGHKG